MTTQLDTQAIAATQSYLRRFNARVDINFVSDGVCLALIGHKDYSILVKFDGPGLPQVFLDEKGKPFNPMAVLDDDYSGRGNPQELIEDWIESLNK